MLWKILLGKPFGRSSISSIWHQMSSNHHTKYIKISIHHYPIHLAGVVSIAARTPWIVQLLASTELSCCFKRQGFFSTPFRGKHQICWDYCQGTKLLIFTLTFTGRKINCICGGSIFFWWSWKIFDKLSFIIEWFIELCLKAVKVSGGWFGWWWYHQSNVSDTFWSREWDALSKKRVLVDCKKVNKWWSVGLNST